MRTVAVSSNKNAFSDQKCPCLRDGWMLMSVLHSMECFPQDGVRDRQPQSRSPALTAKRGTFRLHRAQLLKAHNSCLRSIRSLSLIRVCISWACSLFWETHTAQRMESSSGRKDTHYAPKLYVFGLWMEARVPRKDPYKQSRIHKPRVRIGFRTLEVQGHCGTH